MVDTAKYHSLPKKTAGFVLLAIGLLFLIILLRNIVHDFPIWFFGRRVPGVVEETWYEVIEESDAGELSFKYFMRYSFTTPNGETLEGSTSLAAQEWSALSEGSEVPIVYSPFNSLNNRLDDSRFVPLLLCAYIPFIFITWFSLATGWNLLSEAFRKPEPAW